MYCKKCGKKLDKNTRFCERCGTSVNRENTPVQKKEETEELAKSRLERSVTKKKKRLSDKSIILIVILAVLIIMAVPAFISYSVMTDHSKDALWRTQDGSAKMNATPTPEATDSPKETDSSTLYTLTDNINEDGYAEYEFDKKVFLYPSDFVKASTGGESRLKVVDSAGDGVIELKIKSDNDQKPQQLMLDYAQSDGANKVQTSRAGDDWYTIDIINGENFIHRKCVLVNGAAISYTFTYPATSRYKSLYKQYGEYMDKNFNY